VEAKIIKPHLSHQIEDQLWRISDRKAMKDCLKRSRTYLPWSLEKDE
jgi:hypothetical protein